MENNSVFIAVPAEKRDVPLRVRLSKSQVQVVKQRASIAGISVSEWFRRSIFQQRIRPRVSEKEMDRFLKLIELSNDLTELRKIAAKDGLLLIHRECRELLSAIDLILRKFSHHDRKNIH